MFEINKYEHKFLPEEKQSIKVEFTYRGEQDRTVVIKMRENAFKLKWVDIRGTINLKKNVRYWISDESQQKFEQFYNNDILFKINDSITDETIFSKELKTSAINLSKRSLGFDFNKKNTWVIGDSHINHFFSYHNSYDIRIFETEKTIINPVSFPLLSINRLINSDYLKTIGNLPIFDGDDICFSIGEIDCRVGIMRNAFNKGISQVEQIYNLSKRFIECLNIIKSKYPKCKLFFVLPNPPIKDNWISDKNLEIYLNGGNQSTRFSIRYLFEEMVISEMKKNDIEVIDIYKNYLGGDMFVDEKYLLTGDHHFKNPNNFLSLFKKYFS